MSQRSRSGNRNILINHAPTEYAVTHAPVLQLGVLVVFGCAATIRDGGAKSWLGKRKKNQNNLDNNRKNIQKNKDSKTIMASIVEPSVQQKLYLSAGQRSSARPLQKERMSAVRGSGSRLFACAC
jgi:hypothetical protein